MVLVVGSKGSGKGVTCPGVTLEPWGMSWDSGQGVRESHHEVCPLLSIHYSLTHAGGGLITSLQQVRGQRMGGDQVWT